MVNFLRSVFVLVMALSVAGIKIGNCQVSAYSFTQSSSTFVEITGGTILGTATGNGIGNPSLDDINFVIPNGSFPFPFVFNGVAYTGCNVNTNGYITFGTTLPAAGSPYTPISSTVAFAGAVSAWGRDINAVFNIGGETGEIRWEVVGTAPNREIVIQWKNFRPNYSSSTTVAYVHSFQIKLQEDGNKISFVYGNGSYLVGSSSITGTIQVGLRGANNADYNNRLNNTALSFNASTAGTANTSTQAYNTVNATPGLPTSGLTYTWAPPFLPCSGLPEAGTTKATVDSACASQNFTLSLAGADTSTDLTFQWVSSTDGISFSNTAGTSKTFTTSVTTDTYFRCIVTCPTSGLSDTSTVLFLKLNSFLNCYCGAPLTNTVNTVDIVTKVVLINAANDSLVQTSASNGSNNYDIYNNVPLNIQASTSNTLKITYGTDGTQFGAAWIDFNRNGIFEAGENIALTTSSVGGSATSTFTFFAPSNVSVGVTRMRVRGGADAAYTAAGACTATPYGETEDYFVNLIAASGCIDPPTAGAITATKTSLCANDSSTLSASGYSLFTDLQWQVSTDSVLWTNVSGANSVSLNSGTISVKTFYRLKVTCTDSAFSNVITLNIAPPSGCYCTPPASDCSLDDDILNVTLNLINNTTGCSPTGFSSYTTPVDTLFQGVSSSLSVTVGDGGNEYVGVWIDYNQNGIFEASEFTNLGIGNGSTVTNFLNVPLGASIGNTIMRVRIRWNTALTANDACLGYSYGETEDYSVYIAPAPPCLVPTVGGTISGPNTGDAGAVETFVLNGYTGNPFWEIATNISGPYTSLNVNNDSLQLFLNAVGTFYLRAKVATPGCADAFSDTLTLVITQRGDEPCDAIQLSFGANGPYTMEFATASPREVRPGGGGCETQSTWCNTNATNTLWFKFVAPPSGRVIVRAPGMDSQLALWDADSCTTLADSTLGNFTLLAANDDDPNALLAGANLYSSFIDTVNCLTPGKTYYVQLDPWSAGDTDTTSIFLFDAGIVDASFTGFNGDVYCELASSESLTPVRSGGLFTGTGIENVNEFNPALAGIGGPYIISHTLLGCYTFSDTITITGNPVYDSVSVSNVACYGDSSAEITVYFSNATLPLSYQWNNSSTNQTVTNLPAGSYTVTVISNDGCPGFSPQFDVTEPASALSASLVANDVKCFGANDGTATVAATGGTPTYSYVWSNTVSISSTVSVLPTGAFTVIVTDANNCSLVFADTIEDNTTAITISTSTTDVSCNGGNNGNVTAIVTGGNTPYSFVWSNSSSTTEVVNNATANVYAVTVTDVNLCTATAVDTVNQPSSISASSVATAQAGSTNGSINVTVSGGSPNYTFDWSNNATTKDISAVAGIYTLTITDANNCTFVLSDTIDFISGISQTNGGIKKLSLFPNPTTGIATLSISSEESQFVIVEVLDVTGRLLQTIRKQEVTDTTVQLDLKELAAGMYHVRIQLNDATITKQLILQR